MLKPPRQTGDFWYIKFYSQPHFKVLCIATGHRTENQINLGYVWGCKTVWYCKTYECCVMQLSEQLACEEMSSKPGEPAGLTYPCTAPGIVKGAALSLQARGWLTVHGGSGRAVTELRASLSPRYLPNLQKTVSHFLLVTQLFPKHQANNPGLHKGLGLVMYRWGISRFSWSISESFFIIMHNNSMSTCLARL